MELAPTMPNRVSSECHECLHSDGRVAIEVDEHQREQTRPTGQGRWKGHGRGKERIYLKEKNRDYFEIIMFFTIFATAMCIKRTIVGWATLTSGLTSD